MGYRQRRWVWNDGNGIHVESACNAQLTTSTASSKTSMSNWAREWITLRCSKDFL